jgi:hypothetical protein
MNTDTQEIIEKQPDDLTAKLMNLAIVGFATFLLTYVFIPEIRNNYFEIGLIVIMVVAVYIIYELYF